MTSFAEEREELLRRILDREMPETMGLKSQKKTVKEARKKLRKNLMNMTLEQLRKRAGVDSSPHN